MWIQLRRNKVALACGGLFVVIVKQLPLVACCGADHVAHVTNENHITDKVLIEARRPKAVSPDGIPSVRGRTAGICWVPTRQRPRR